MARDVVAGRYLPGQTMPAESTLASAYHVSKPTVRQGLSRLANLGLISIQQGKRTVVLEESSWNVLDPAVHEAFSAAGRASELSRHLWEVRVLLESAAATWAAERGSDADRDEAINLAAELRRIASGSGDVRHFLTVDQAFHQTVARMASNPALRHAMEPTHRFLSQQLWSAHSRARFAHLDTLASQHEEIALALRDRDPARARDAMERHIRFAEGLETS